MNLQVERLINCAIYVIILTKVGNVNIFKTRIAGLVLSYHQSQSN